MFSLIHSCDQYVFLDGSPGAVASCSYYDSLYASVGAM